MSRRGLVKTVIALALGAAACHYWEHRNDTGEKYLERRELTTTEAYAARSASFQGVLDTTSSTLGRVANLFDAGAGAVEAATGFYADVASASSRVKAVREEARTSVKRLRADGLRADAAGVLAGLHVADRRLDLEREADSNRSIRNNAAQTLTERANAERRRSVRFNDDRNRAAQEAYERAWRNARGG